MNNSFRSGLACVITSDAIIKTKLLLVMTEAQMIIQIYAYE